MPNLVVAGVGMAFGLALRVVNFINRPSLGLDEARLALNIATRSWASLMSGLSHDQSAPLLFLWMEKAAVDILGVSDLALRLLPLAAGIGTLLLTYAVSRRLLSAAGAAFATAIVGSMPTLVYYSTGVKQYGVEILITMVLVALALKWLDRTRTTSALPLILAGLLAPWTSAPAVFVLSGIIAAMAAAGTFHGDARARRALSWAVPLWACSFLSAYFVMYRSAMHNPYLQHYWRPAFLGLGDESLLVSLAAVGKEVFWGVTIGYPGALAGGSLDGTLTLIGAACCLLSALGVKGLVRRAGSPGVFLVVGPIVAALCASVLGFYPVVLRLMLFALPLILLLLLSGMDEIMVWCSPLVRRLAWVTAGLVTVLPLLVVSFVESTSVNPPEHLRPLVGELRRLRHSGEPVYVFAGSIPSWAFYSSDWSAPDRARLAVIERWASSGGPAFENAPSRGHPVQHEGADLYYDTPSGRELYGVSTGIEWRPIYGVVRRTTDLGWAENEAERIRVVAAPGVWILMSHTVGDEISLLRKLEDAGGRAVYRRSLNDAMLVRYVFGDGAQ
jgi:hypothetical protein